MSWWSDTFVNWDNIAAPNASADTCTGLTFTEKDRKLLALRALKAYTPHVRLKLLAFAPLGKYLSVKNDDSPLPCNSDILLELPEKYPKAYDNGSSLSVHREVEN